MKVKLNLPNHVIADQMHAEIGALDAIDAAFASVPDATRRMHGIPHQQATLDEVCPPL
jgi:hypothetical protein